MPVALGGKLVQRALDPVTPRVGLLRGRKVLETVTTQIGVRAQFRRLSQGRARRRAVRRGRGGVSHGFKA